MSPDTILLAAFGLDALACSRCGGRRLIATISDLRVIERILAHFARASASALALPSPPVPAAQS